MEKEEYKINFEKAEGYLKKGNFNQAIREFETVLEKWPDDSRCYNKLGVCYASLRDFVKAKSYLEKALTLDLKYPEPYNNLGNICLERKEYEKSIELYKKALELNPDYAAAHSNLGLAYKRTKRINEAVKQFKKAAEITFFKIIFRFLKINFIFFLIHKSILQNKINYPVLILSRN